MEKFNCRDCHVEDERIHGSQREKCWNCLDRDQSYRERGERAQYE